jgi:hypothetical protein
MYIPIYLLLTKNENTKYCIRCTFYFHFFKLGVQQVHTMHQQSFGRCASAGQYSSPCARRLCNCGTGSCCRSRRARRSSDGIICCWALLYNDYNPGVVAMSIVGTGGLSIPVIPMPRAIGSPLCGSANTEKAKATRARSTCKAENSVFICGTYCVLCVC